MYLKNIFSVPTVFALSLVSAGGAFAVPIEFSDNGHFYDFVPGSFTFNEAVAASQVEMLSMNGNTLQGYVVTITSQEENDFLVSNFAGNRGWIGASDSNTEGAWEWINGPEEGEVFWLNGTTQTYDNWGVAEPNNFSGANPQGEDAAELDMNNLNSTSLGQWNDITALIEIGYFIEFSEISAAQIPSPTPLILMLSTLVGLSFRVKRAHPPKSDFS